MFEPRLLTRLEEKKAQLEALRPLPVAAVNRLNEQLTAEWIYNSNAIEGNTLTLRETQLILETGLMGAVAGLFAMPTGYILAVILVYIINLRSFGWTLQMQVEPGPFIQGFVVAVGASLLAGLYPARRILQRNTAEVIRFE